MAETLDILLATFNGARFLPEQLASIEAQTCRDWRLIVRDDGSTDRSPALLEAFAERHAGRVLVVRDGRGRLGACGNFAALLERSDAEYFMFCDQDDVWLPDKIARLLTAMREAEARYGSQTPILVHTDLVVVDAALRVLHPSFRRYTRLPGAAAPRRPARVLARNCVTGCAAIGNAALRRAALPVPNEAHMHDWWIALVAAMLGQIVEHDSATVLYRQHTANQIGAMSGRFAALVRAILRSRGDTLRSIRAGVRQSQRQAAAFERSHGDVLDAGTREMVAEFGSLGEAGWWRRKSYMFRYRKHVWPDYWVELAALLWLL